MSDNIVIDLRSDTVTKPTLEMRAAMASAEVGDDVYGDDPTVNELEVRAAQALGFEAAVFVPSGTMGNQAAIMAHTRPGDEIIASAEGHIIRSEAGGPARLSGVSCALTAGSRPSPDDIRRLARQPDNIHHPRSRLVYYENALSDGDVVPLEEMAEIRHAAQEYGLLVHVDGARLFNAAVSLGTEARELAAQADSVMFCLSKGLCAPVGSLVAGRTSFITEVRRCRKLLGGGMRQAGILAAAGLIALDRMTGRLAEDHQNAQLLGRGLAEMPGLEIDLNRLKINLVFWRTSLSGFEGPPYVDFMARRGILVSGPNSGLYRLATHNDVSRRGVETFLSCFKEYIATLIH